MRDRDTQRARDGPKRQRNLGFIRPLEWCKVDTSGYKIRPDVFCYVRHSHFVCLAPPVPFEGDAQILLVGTYPIHQYIEAVLVTNRRGREKNVSTDIE